MGLFEKLGNLLDTARCIYVQRRHGKRKACCVHEPKVECIAEGKAGKAYECGRYPSRPLV